MLDLKKEEIVHTLRSRVNTRKIVATTSDNLFPNSDGRKLSSVPSLIFFIDQSHLSYFPRGGIASFVDKLASLRTSRCVPRGENVSKSRQERIIKRASVRYSALNIWSCTERCGTVKLYTGEDKSMLPPYLSLLPCARVHASRTVRSSG